MRMLWHLEGGKIVKLIPARFGDDARRGTSTPALRTRGRRRKVQPRAAVSAFAHSLTGVRAGFDLIDLFLIDAFRSSSLFWPACSSGG
jgi:hypothetical protein